MIQKLSDPFVTPEMLLEHPDGDHYELVDGTLVEKNVSVTSSWVEFTIQGYLRDFTEKHQLGRCWNNSLGYRIFPDAPNKVRRPDASFIKGERLTPELFTQGYMTLVPDLVVEVVSDNDLAYEVDLKIEEYLQAGVPLVWILNPETRTVTIHRQDGSTARLHETDTLEGEAVLPGFAVSVVELFPRRQEGGK